MPSGVRRGQRGSLDRRWCRLRGPTPPRSRRIGPALAHLAVISRLMRPGREGLARCYSLCQADYMTTPPGLAPVHTEDDVLRRVDQLIEPDKRRGAGPGVVFLFRDPPQTPACVS